MKSSVSAVTPCAAITTFALLLAACTPSTPPQEPTATTGASAAPSEPMTQPDQPAATVSRAGPPVLGRYVDPQSLQVTGIDSRFSASDHLFASIPFESAAANDAVVARLIDTTGTELARREIRLAGGEPRVNFDFQVPDQLKLTPGAYVVEFLISGQPVSRADFKVE